VTDGRCTKESLAAQGTYPDGLGCVAHRGARFLGDEFTATMCGGEYYEVHG
jgi:hypothetical protein